MSYHILNFEERFAEKRVSPLEKYSMIFSWFLMPAILVMLQIDCSRCVEQEELKKSEL